MKPGRPEAPEPRSLTAKIRHRRASERFTSALGRISRRLSADPELRAVRRRLEERLAQARTELESGANGRGRAACAPAAERDAEGLRPAGVLRWKQRGSA